MLPEPWEREDKARVHIHYGSINFHLGLAGAEFPCRSFFRIPNSDVD